MCPSAQPGEPGGEEGAEGIAWASRSGETAIEEFIAHDQDGHDRWWDHAELVVAGSGGQTHDAGSHESTGRHERVADTALLTLRADVFSGG